MSPLLLVVALACSQAPEPAAPAVPPAASPAEAPSGTLPPPFPAAALRAGLKPGTRIRLKLEPGGEESWEVTAVDDETCTMITRKDGVETTETTPWTELEAHAHFPAARTTREDTTVTTAAGTFPAWHYTVQPGPDELPAVREFWFAKDQPGPPVLMTITRDGQVAVRMEVLERAEP